MEKYKKLIKLDEKTFRRVTWVKKETFSIMLEILKKAEKKRERKGGRKRKLEIADCLLLSLEYLREYRTYLHISVDYGISESQAQRTHRWVEKTLISDKRFHLPFRRKLQDKEQEFEVFLLDATECEIERPKKTKKMLFLKEKKRYFKSSSIRECKNKRNFLYWFFWMKKTWFSVI